MTFFRIQLSALAIVLGLGSQAQAASLVTFGNPWGQRTTVTAAMDQAFGPGAWADLNAPADSGFLTGETFAYLEGGDFTTNAMESFLIAEATSILNWVSGGGRLFVNAAPNEGDGLSFGGLTLNYLSTFCGSLCSPVDPTHPIFSGITSSSFGGTFFSHGTVTGGSTDYIVDSDGASLLSSIALGSGAIFMGTMTTTNFHSLFDDEALTLRANILAFAANGAVDPVPPVPLPAAAWMLLAGLVGLAGLSRAKKAA